jgi:hypothetical protein
MIGAQGPAANYGATNSFDTILDATDGVYMRIVLISPSGEVFRLDGHNRATFFEASDGVTYPYQQFKVSRFE